jgi:hypothetical protein
VVLEGELLKRLEDDPQGTEGVAQLQATWKDNRPMMSQIRNPLHLALAATPLALLLPVRIADRPLGRETLFEVRLLETHRLSIEILKI